MSKITNIEFPLDDVANMKAQVCEMARPDGDL